MMLVNEIYMEKETSMPFEIYGIHLHKKMNKQAERLVWGYRFLPAYRIIIAFNPEILYN